jgi:hypothetical protein
MKGREPQESTIYDAASGIPQAKGEENDINNSGFKPLQLI